MANPSHLTSGKIRDVAIVISSVDRSMQRQMLLQLPTDQARLVRQAMLNLGDVSEPELRRALASFQSQVNAPSSSAGGSSIVNSPPKNDSIGSTDLSPAESALQSAAQTAPDQLDLSQQAHSAAFASTEFHSDSEPVEKAAMSEHERYWASIPLDDLLTVLRDERGIVIAIVLNQVPAETAKKIAAHLPKELAVESLHQLATLSETDSEIVNEIHQHLKQRLADYQGPKKNRQANVARLQTLLESVSEDRKLAALDDLKDVQPNLARELADKLQGETVATQSSSTANGVNERNNGFEADESFFPAASENAAHSDPDYADILPFRSRKSQRPENSENQIGDARTVKSMGSQLQTPQPDPFTGNVGEKNPAVSINFSQLKMLSQEDLATVFKSTEARTVLMALSGATPEFYSRFTNMLHPRDAQRLQKKLLSLGPLQMREIDAAQQTLCQNAGHLMATGQIGALFNLTVTAAA